MDINTLLPMLTPLLVGPLAAFLAQVAKLAPAIPFQGKTVAALVAVLGVIALACELGIAILTGNLAAFDFERLASLLIQTVASVLTAAGTYGLLKKGGAIS